MPSVKTTVVNLRNEEYDVYIGRAGHGLDGYFGNPIQRTRNSKPGDTIPAYKVYFYRRLSEDAEFKRRVHELQGKRLGCFCKPGPCHGDIIAEYVNNL